MTKNINSYLIHSFFVFIFTGFLTTSQAQVTPKIIGGKPSNSTQWPWMAGLVSKNASSVFFGQFCGASLIAKQWVLTAAHCVIGEDTSTFDVIINRPNLDIPTGELISVDRIISHPFYNDNNLNNDLALIKLKSPSITPPIAIVPLYSMQDNAGKKAIALGWGTTSAVKNIYPTNLQEAELSIIDNSSCSNTLSGITNNTLCAGVSSATKDTCQGDSGGPLIVFDTESQSWRQAGITSWGNGCAKRGFYGVYTRVKNYATFISDNICSPNEIPLPTFLNLNINKNTATVNWNQLNTSDHYRLIYAPFPQANPIVSRDLNNDTQFSTMLASGSAFYVGITSYNNNCISQFSNIERFIVQ